MKLRFLLIFIKILEATSIDLDKARYYINLLVVHDNNSVRFKKHLANLSDMISELSEESKPDRAFETKGIKSMNKTSLGESYTTREYSKNRTLQRNDQMVECKEDQGNNRLRRILKTKFVKELLKARERYTDEISGLLFTSMDDNCDLIQLVFQINREATEEIDFIIDELKRIARDSKLINELSEIRNRVLKRFPFIKID